MHHAQTTTTVYLATINEEAVHDINSHSTIHHSQEQGKKPAKRDHGQNLKLVLQFVIQFREMFFSQTLKHNYNVIIQCYYGNVIFSLFGHVDIVHDDAHEKVRKEPGNETNPVGRWSLPSLTGHTETATRVSVTAASIHFALIKLMRGQYLAH